MLPTRPHLASRLGVNGCISLLPPIRQHGVVLDKLTFHLDNSLVRFVVFSLSKDDIVQLAYCSSQTLGQSVTSQWTLIRKIHYSGLEVDQQETRLGKHVALDTTRAARVLKHFRTTYRPRFQFCGI